MRNVAVYYEATLVILKRVVRVRIFQSAEVESSHDKQNICHSHSGEMNVLQSAVTKYIPMKNQIQTHHCSLFKHFAEPNLCKISALILSLIGLPSAVFADATWVGSTSQDWNNAANWSSSPANPTGSFFINTATAGVYPIVTANSAFTPVDILIGDASTVGRLNQTAGNLATGPGNWLMVGRNGTGTYNLTGGTLTAGGVHLARTTGTAVATGTMNVTNGRLMLPDQRSSKTLTTLGAHARAH